MADGVSRDGGSVLLVALGGVTATYVAMAARYRMPRIISTQAIAQTAQLDAAVNDHEIQSHKLWQGTPVDRTAFQRGQSEIPTCFTAACADLHGAGEHALVAEAAQRVALSADEPGPMGARRTAASGRSDGGDASGLRQRAGPGLLPVRSD